MTAPDFFAGERDHIRAILDQHAEYAPDNPKNGRETITEFECQRMCELDDSGYATGEIARRVDWSRDAVKYHIRGRCTH